MKLIFILFLTLIQLKASMTREQMENFVLAPMQLGIKDSNLPIWPILNSGGGKVAYIFESQDLIPTIGFSGGEMNLLISIDLKGSFLDVLVLQQSEPVFVGGLGIIPFNQFLQQYRGKSLASNIKVAKTKTSGANIHIDGITKATASVKIANETILASAIKVAKERLSGVAPKPISYPRKDIYKQLTWNQLVEKGLVKHLLVTNKYVEALFKGTEYEGEDEIALKNPEDTYIDLWVADLGLPIIAKNLLSKQTQKEINEQLTPFEEPILVMANGRHQIVSPSFVRNSVPDLLEIRQGDFPINIRDGDFEVELLNQIPKMQQAMVFQVDTRFGFDPSQQWTLKAKVIRGDNYLYSIPIIKDLEIDIQLPKKYFLTAQVKDTTPAWLSSWYNQKYLLSVLGIFILLLFFILFKYKYILKNLKKKRFFILLFTLIFVGWYGQGQLTMVTVLGVIKSIFTTQNLSFLLYDPFSLLIWFFVIISLLIWGRGTYCGWLCPYGVLQEFTHKIGTLLNIPQIKISYTLNNKLIYIKYFILALLVFTTFFASELSDYLLEVEPFKTSITLIFNRSWPYVLYALFWLFLSMFIFKGFCKYICPLGAFLSLGGRLRIFDWLPRRKECGNPCNHCHVSCNYEAIDKDNGAIKYDECFQCLDCVEIHHDENLCKILKKRSTSFSSIKVKKWRQ